MRNKLTIILLLLNAALFLTIWLLERAPEPQNAAGGALSDFTTLSVEGKTLNSPRIIKLENNRWRIIKPIEWPANFFAVNRIKSQLEYLDRQTSFALSEIKSHGQTLADYGLDAPNFTFKFGGEKKMSTLKVGKAAPIGNKIYMLDEAEDRIIVVDRELVESLAIDIDRLRSQNVFEIPRFEVGAISIRIPQETPAGSTGAKFLRIGLVKDGLNWKFESPVAAEANNKEVEAFINSLCSVSARSFVSENKNMAGFDVGAFPLSITLQGVNRRQVLLIGNPVPDSNLVYAKLEDNPTIFTLEADKFKNLGALRTSLRDKKFIKFDIADVAGMDIFSGNDSVKLRSLKDGQWEMLADKSAENIPADSVKANTILSTLANLSARDFASDTAKADFKTCGLDTPALKITLLLNNQTTKTLLVGKTYKYGAAHLAYAAMEGGETIYGIPVGIIKAFPANRLAYRSRIISALPEKAEVAKIKLVNIPSGKTAFELDVPDGKNLAQTIAAMADKRQRQAASLVAEYARKFAAQNFSDSRFEKDGFKDENGNFVKWQWKLEVTANLQGTGKTISQTDTYLMANRAGGTTQYAGFESCPYVFNLPQKLINALFEFESGLIEQAKAAPAPNAPAPKK